MKRPRPAMVIGIASLLSGVVAWIFVWRGLHPADTLGRAVLHTAVESREQAILDLPTGWRARYGVERQGKCAVLLDADSRPRMMTCAIGNGPARPDGEAALAKRIAALHSHPGETVASAVDETPSGPIHRVTRAFHSSATFHVVKSGDVVEHRFVRNVQGQLVELDFYEDAAERVSLDPIALALAANARIESDP